MSLEPSTAAAESRGDRLRGAAPAGLAGIGAAALGVGLGELAAAFLQTTASPIVAVGALLIDLAPPWAKDTAIASKCVVVFMWVGVLLEGLMSQCWWS